MRTLEVWAMKLPHRRRMIKKVTSTYYREFTKEIKGKRVLEIGCGHGFGVAAIRTYFSPGQIIATDLDPRMIASAKQRNKDPNVIFEMADATRLHYKNSSFKAVFEYGVLHHIPSPLWKSCLKELYRVLSNKGMLFLYDNSIESFQTFWGRINRLISKHPYESMYKKRELLDYILSLGFVIKKDINLGRYFIIIAQK